ncbi:MAG: hypothetical protein HY077_04500 [Elusimicrobia bacterium]|nr:hypothetical protein [Elusimicrobiota bacterium]
MIAAFTAAKAAVAVEISPIYGLQMLGGQSFYSGQKGTLSGNLNGTIAPAMKFNDKWSLLPTINTAYQGTEQVLDVVGGQTLFQMQWDNLAAAKLIYTPEGSDWRLKPSTSFKYELLKESNDERLGSGLFDYYQWSAGFEGEYLYRDPFSFHAGGDYFELHFPNYTSLESQAATNFGGQSLARELVGNRVIDTQNAMLGLGVSAPIQDRFVVEGGGRVLYQHFPNQHLVDATGNLTTPLRDDVATTLSGSLKMPVEFNADLRTLGALDLSGTYNSSNQNNFDASQTKFIPYFYNYGEVKVAPSFKLLVGSPRQPIVLGLSAAYWYRRYPYRPTQDPAGAYLSDHIHTNNWMTGANLNYPMAPHFSLVFDFNYGRGSSNQQFEQFFKYNYSTSNYWFGFNYLY